MRNVRFTVIAAAAMAISAVLSSCSAGLSDTVPMPLPTTSGSPSAAPTTVPDPDPTLLPGGTALANLEYFDFVNARLIVVNSEPSSAAIVENLLNAGFAKADLEVTPDKTDQLRRPVDSIQFAVRTSEGCLLGHIQAGQYSSMVGPAVNGEACLIGETETIP